MKVAAVLRLRGDGDGLGTSLEDYIMRGKFGWKSLFAVGAVIVVAGTAVHTQAGGQAPAQPRPAPQVTAIRAGRLFDGKTATYQNNQIILVTGDRITDVGPAV